MNISRLLFVVVFLLPLTPTSANEYYNHLPKACYGVSFPTDDRACLISLAKKGGLVLYTRHVRTDTDFADQDDPNTNLDNCNAQRRISDEGWEQAAELRDAIDFFRIKARSVIGSQFCRAWQTAVQMYGRINSQEPRLNFVTEEECGGPDDPDLQQCLDETAQDNLWPLLSKRVSPRRNRALVAHDDPFRSATGFYPFPMGSTYLIKPKGLYNGFEVLGCISPDAWFGDTPTFECNLDSNLTADDFDEGVPEPD